MKKARTKCYIYTRVSTAMQVDGYSLDAQREKLRKYADYEDMVIMKPSFPRTTGILHRPSVSVPQGGVKRSVTQTTRIFFLAF